MDLSTVGNERGWACGKVGILQGWERGIGEFFGGVFHSVWKKFVSVGGFDFPQNNAKCCLKNRKNLQKSTCIILGFRLN